MPQDKTTGNQVDTAGNDPVSEETMIGLAGDIGRDMGALLARLDHLDSLCHGIDQKLTAISALLEQHKPLLDRAHALIDPGAKVRAALGIKGKRSG